MNLNKKYRVTVEDESSLEKRINLSARLYIFLFLIIVFVVVAGVFGVFILASTPLKTHLPGYLKESERTATEEQHLRLDSLSKVYEINEAYITGILNALNPPQDSLKRENQRKPLPLNPDSIMEISEEEKAFMERIRERDKYNIVYTSPAAAQNLMFGSVNKAAVITNETKDKYQAEIIVPTGASISTVAEGKVISIANSPKYAGGYEVIIQHPKGFLSKSSRLKNLMVKPGDRVAAGQIIASGSANNGVKSDHIIFELWHDGDPLVPARYLNGGSHQTNQ